MTAREALSKLCYTSERTNDGEVYTIADRRYPEYTGRQIEVKLVRGEYEISWRDATHD